MASEYTRVENLAALLDEIKPDTIVSRTFFKGDGSKGAGMNAILFGFDSGQELSEHTASQNAIIQILQGEATITVGDDRYEAEAGFWLQMAPRLKHSVYAKSKLIMLLMLYGAAN